MVVYVIQSKDEFCTKLKEAGDKLVVVDFFAEWCGPCKTIAPAFEAFSTKYADVIFCKVDSDDLGELCAEYSVTALPTFIFFMDGQQIDQLIGGDGPKVEGKIQQHRVIQQQQCCRHAQS